MAVEFDVKGTRTSEYLFAPEDIEAIAELAECDQQGETTLYEIRCETVQAIRSALES